MFYDGNVILSGYEAYLTFEFWLGTTWASDFGWVFLEGLLPDITLWLYLVFSNYKSKEIPTDPWNIPHPLNHRDLWRKSSTNGVPTGVKLAAGASLGLQSDSLLCISRPSDLQVGFWWGGGERGGGLEEFSSCGTHWCSICWVFIFPLWHKVQVFFELKHILSLEMCRPLTHPKTNIGHDMVFALPTTFYEPRISQYPTRWACTCYTRRHNPYKCPY